MTPPLVVERSAPIVAWRYWQLAPASMALRSVSQRRCEWVPGRPLRAACLGGGHRPPDEGCGCGIYGSETLEALRDHGLCLAPEPLVVGEVELWGTVARDGDAWRAEYAYPRSLSLVAETVTEVPLDRVMAALARYEVPLSTTTLETSVGELSGTILANQAMALRTRTITG